MKGEVQGFWKHPCKLSISIFILLVIGSHALPVLQGLQGHKQTFWPIMSWSMYRNSYDGKRPIQVSIRRLIGITSKGQEFEINDTDSGLFYFGFVRLYLTPIINGDASAAQGLARRVNVGRKDPVVGLRLEGETYTLVNNGMIKKYDDTITYSINQD
jgi:hypothetical protein